ncbi:phage tail protein [Mixta mediterraneensis]|uniref:phage tail protein n=1 Tax=Mixta mediterraneensis TaxID=2758443 RepID=UPI0018767CDA|nr:phage tail protein [Mixta mediterraneensis]MBE5250676.1 phage tail protein [Mixta mediterraneensis]
MATKYFALLTNIGAAKLANATAMGAQVEITQMAVGDGNGALPTPNPAQTALTHELRRAQLNMLTIDPVNTNQIIAEQVIPEDVGGWWIREIGLFDKDGDMIAVANCAETYKPQLQEGSGRVQVIRVILIVSSTEVVTLKIDPSVVLATRKYVDDAIIEVKAYVDKVMKQHIETENPHNQYLLIENALKEMADNGLINDVLKNLGLGEGSALPVGIPVPWPTSTPPTGWLKCNGAAFSAKDYPQLAKVYPALKLLDLRGEFIRGWDDGRGVDSGRGIGTNQNATSIRTAALDYYGNDDSTAENGALVGTAFSQADSAILTQPGTARSPNNGALGSILHDNSMVCTQSQGGKLTDSVWITSRPRNIALNYIVRAA